MGCYKIGEHIPGRRDLQNIFHPRFTGAGIPPPTTFHAVIYDRADRRGKDGDEWCFEEAWFAHSPDFDFRVKDQSGYIYIYIWGLPVLVPTCPKKLFEQGPRKKYVDIVTDALHASSSDLITWNTLVMMKLRWIDLIPKQWLEITTQSLEWEARDQDPPFLPDNRRGCARVTPVALSEVASLTPMCSTWMSILSMDLGYMTISSHGKSTLGMYGQVGQPGLFSQYMLTQHYRQ